MPKKTVYKKGAQNFDSFKTGKNERLDPRFKHYEVDPDSLFETAADIAAGNETDELRAAQRERERREKISASNRSVRAEGRAFEEMLIRACEAYQAAGKCEIVKIPEPRRVVGRTGGRTSMMICVNDRKAHPDFMGSLAPNGRCFVFDAKHTSKGEMKFQAVTKNQAEILDRHVACGAICYIAVSFGFEKFFMVPYEVWKDMRNVFGRQYLLPDDEELKRYAVPFEIGVNEKGKEEKTVWFLDEVSFDSV